VLEHYYTALEELHGTLSDIDKQEIVATWFRYRSHVESLG
jgi:hypothetical protein